MNEMFNDENLSGLFEKAKNMINEGNIPDEVKDMMSKMTNNNGSGNNSTGNMSSGMPDIDMETMMKIKSVMEQMQKGADDPRANLLKSLKPYLRETRKDKVDQYVKMLNMSKVIETLNKSGNDSSQKS